MRRRGRSARCPTSPSATPWRNRPPSGRRTGPTKAGALHEAVVEAGTYPHLAATPPVLTSTDFTAHFGFGLRLLLDGPRAVRR
ncbi:TetR/AcrR family transcriptional regulator C-terminal domain-containing protein [Streptomyces sp. NPDC057381]|uniref:TetR/AcrR family transcriptional regulator C-terminal domain-containing protein n=1 Tax=Streptomyces sp. NPDC057381 TaxID=3346111 RepID=UPI0036292613